MFDFSFVVSASQLSYSIVFWSHKFKLHFSEKHQGAPTPLYPDHFLYSRESSRNQKVDIDSKGLSFTGCKLWIKQCLFSREVGNENRFKAQTWNQEGLKRPQMISGKLDLAPSLTARMRWCFSSPRFIPRSELRLKGGREGGGVSELAAFSSESRSI